MKNLVRPKNCFELEENEMWEISGGSVNVTMMTDF